MQKLSLVALASLLSIVFAVPAAAQEGTGRTNASYDREISINYSYLRDFGQNGNLGLMVDFGKQLSANASVIGEFAVNHFSYWEENYVQAAGGVRFGAVTSPGLRPYAQIMVGLQREFGESGYVIQPGAGLNIAMGRMTDVRVQVDFPVLKWDGDTFKQFRFSAGLGLALGGR